MLAALTAPGAAGAAPLLTTTTFEGEQLTRRQLQEEPLSWGDLDDVEEFGDILNWEEAEEEWAELEQEYEAQMQEEMQDVMAQSEEAEMVNFEETAPAAAENENENDDEPTEDEEPGSDDDDDDEAVEGEAEGVDDETFVNWDEQDTAAQEEEEVVDDSFVLPESPGEAEGFGSCLTDDEKEQLRSLGVAVVSALFIYVLYRACCRRAKSNPKDDHKPMSEEAVSKV